MGSVTLGNKNQNMDLREMSRFVFSTVTDHHQLRTGQEQKINILFQCKHKELFSFLEADITESGIQGRAAATDDSWWDKLTLS